MSPRQSPRKLEFPSNSQSPILRKSRIAGPWIAAAERTFGRIDILVNVAALTDRGNLLNTSPDFFDRMFALIVRGPFFPMQDVVKVMIRHNIAGSTVGRLE
jgi:NAD(P)-dependent dehydrogenase (short-subunit alcohol dehydrogenase family)